MTKSTKIVTLSLPPEIVTKVEQLMKEEGRTEGELLEEALRQYIASGERWRRIRQWGRETAGKYGIKDERDVERIREEYWEECRRENLGK